MLDLHKAQLRATRQLSGPQLCRQPQKRGDRHVNHVRRFPKFLLFRFRATEVQGLFPLFRHGSDVNSFEGEPARPAEENSRDEEEHGCRTPPAAIIFCEGAGHEYHKTAKQEKAHSYQAQWGFIWQGMPPAVRSAYSRPWRLAYPTPRDRGGARREVCQVTGNSGSRIRLRYCGCRCNAEKRQSAKKTQPDVQFQRRKDLTFCGTVQGH